MDIRVSGHQIDTGDRLAGPGRQPTRRDRRQIFRSRDLRPGDLRQAVPTITASPATSSRTCPRAWCSRAAGAAAEAPAAFEIAADRIEKQLRRYKRRLKDRHAQAAYSEAAADAIDDAGYTVFAPPREEESEPVDNPPIVAETRVDIPDATVSDAVMLLDLRNTNALMFRNSGSGRFNMVYRRGDGTIGWVEPQRD